jgi:serine/threonine protein kinase
VINDSEEGFFYLVTEYFSGGCFLSAKHREMRPFDFIFDQNRYRIKEAIAKKYFQQLCSALDYMHNYAKIVHRDIKPENCLIDDARIAFADFGLSKKAGSSESDNFGTAFYMAP